MILDQNNKITKLKEIMALNGKPTREWLSREDNLIPTASLQEFFTMAKIDGTGCYQYINSDQYVT